MFFRHRTATRKGLYSLQLGTGALALAFCASTQAQTSPDDFKVVSANQGLIQFVGKKQAVIGDDMRFQRCTFGMTWNAGSSSCTGTPTTFSSVKDAQDAVDNFNIASGLPLEAVTSWRIANINELRLMVPTPAGASPTAFSIFPNVPADQFWSSTKFSLSATKDIGNFVLDFADGTTSVSSGGGKFIRLVTGYWPNLTFDFQVVPTDHSVVVDVGTVNVGTFYQRCTIGMTWDEVGQTCTGTPTIFTSSGAARTAITALNVAPGFGGIQVWRMPSNNELGSMQPGNNFNPAAPPYILPIFPGTPADIFWGTPAKINFNLTSGNSAVVFGNGKYVRASSAGPDVITLTVTPGAHGSVDQTSQLTIPPGFMSFTAMPDPGYRVASATGDKCVVVKTVLAGTHKYQIFNSPGACNVTLLFERDPNLWFVSSATTPADGSGGSLVCDPLAKNTNTAACTAKPANGYKTQSISGCFGTATDEGIDDYTTGPVSSDCTVTATFAPAYIFTISAMSNGSALCKKAADGTVVSNGALVIEGTPVACEAIPASGYAFTGWGDDCTSAGTSALCSIAAVNKATTVSASFVPVNTSFTGTTVPTSGTGGTAIASFTGGGAACRFDNSATGFVAAPAALPKDQVLPQGMFQFKLIDCDTTPVAVSIEWPNAVQGLSKYGKAAKDATESSYFAPDNLQISGKVSQFTVTDGQKGDEDWTVNREIVDPVMPTEAKVIPPVTVATPVPTLNEWALALLSLLAAATGAVLVRRRDLKG